MSELENPGFMAIFAEKLFIKAVGKINSRTFVVLYKRILVVVELASNYALTIKQQINLENAGVLRGIAEFIGRGSTL